MEDRGWMIDLLSSILYPLSSILYPRSSMAFGGARLMKVFLIPFLLVSVSAALGQSKDQKWRPAAEKELKSLIPARVPVENERIETELRTASGITNGNGKFIAGVVMITAGYSAEGKYSHFFITQVRIKCCNF